MSLAAAAPTDRGHDGATGGVPLVAFRAVTKRFPGVVANDHVSFVLHPGEVHVLLGENGAGKSTLIGMLAGMQTPDDGVIEVAGEAKQIASPRHSLDLGIGTVFQHGMLVPGLSVAENLLLGGAWWRRPRRAALRSRFRETCAAFGIAIDPDVPAGSLSLGEQQQVEIIRALWRGGRVVVLDEPTSMLTPQGIEELGGLMRRMAAQGIGVVFITHKLHEALEYGDRITVLRLGRVVGEIPPEALRQLSRAAATERVIGMMFGHAALHEATASRPTRSLDGTPVLQVQGIATGPGAPRPALHDISFAVQAGEIFGIAGIDGNGQKQLAEVLAGQLPGSGSVLLDGRSLAGLDVGARHRAGLRYVTDDRLGEGTVGSFPVSINLLLKQVGRPPYWRGGLAQGGAITAQAKRLVRAFDVRTPSIETPVGRLSGGNIQKVVLARELEGGARAVIYNKPTYGLDVRNIEAARARIRAAAAQGVATILISTELDEVLEMADRIGVMVGGRMVGIVPAGAEARGAVGRLMTGSPYGH
ncbi:MAG TPA: ABC transporter ATP-binding protein [Acetobacteraceae bacterium]|nr:ABC transporter ATP-binding protein [Acetobacteraceae bacterium]